MRVSIGQGVEAVALLRNGASVTHDATLLGVDLVAAVLHRAFLVALVAWGHVKAAVGRPKAPPGREALLGPVLPGPIAVVSAESEQRRRNPPPVRTELRGDVPVGCPCQPTGPGGMA
jgi:hypothetical protein